MKTVAYFSIAVLLLLASCDSKPEYDATGIFEATTVTVSSETNGKILSFGIDEGGSICRDQTVAIIDTALLVLQCKQLKSQQASAEQSSPDIAAQASALRTQIAHQQNVWGTKRNVTKTVELFLKGIG